MILDHTQNMLFRMQNIKHYIYNPYMEWGNTIMFYTLLMFQFNQILDCSKFAIIA